MRLENLYPNFGRSSPEDQLRMIAEYRLRRAKDLETIPSTKKTPIEKQRVTLSEDEKAIMKSLGLKQKDILALRNSIEVVEEEKSDTAIFADDTFEGGEDE